ncbi:hypothetical protein BM613_02435 [Sulfoacidibacillus thermotolerans]|uniref:Major facilitator superfamily (MFS) profile domain-containing protein n=2 Tax=Sulfoacidibacillus thermotolerans TaxID=1765684 RepID=A0A2U3DCD8_SULT2|nr:hypothetical protein BM613_02435 [Sulfoacidibacillus thermotolerans]
MRAIGKVAKLSQQGWWLLVVATLFMTGIALSGTFINVYIWKMDRTYEAITWFNLFTFFCIPLAFVGGGYLASKIGEAWVMRSGVTVLVIFFAVLLALGPSSVHYVKWLGICFGIGQGFYWFSFHVFSFDFTNPDNRAKFTGLSGLFASLASMTGPYVAGYLIVRVRQVSGYHAVFALSFTIFALLFIATFRLPKKELPHRPQLSLALRLNQDSDWRRLLIGSVVFGLREGLFSFLVALLVFDVSKSEEGLGLYGLYTGFLSLIAFLLAAFIGKREGLRKFGMGLAAFLLGIIPFLFMQSVSARSLFLFGTTTSFVLPFFLVPFGTMVMNEIDESIRSARYRAEHLAVREIALGIGRVVGIGGFLAFVVYSQNVNWIPYLMMALGFAQFLVFLITYRVTYTDRKASDQSVIEVVKEKREGRSLQRMK